MFSGQRAVAAGLCRPVPATVPVRLQSARARQTRRRRQRQHVQHLGPQRRPLSGGGGGGGGGGGRRAAATAPQAGLRLRRARDEGAVAAVQ